MLERDLLYGQPGIITILILSSFLYLLNVINDCLDQWIYCGLLGQVFIGVAWGAPGVQLLAKDTQQVFSQLGYLGLLLLVYEGGLSTSLTSLKANFFLSIAVAITGICIPIGLSFSLLHLADATPLQAFAAGAALCSTSLGTTFTILKTCALTKTRLGIVLSSAAMIDDIVGLVMVQIISNLKHGSTAINATTVVRPVLVSLAFAIFVPFGCRSLLLPGWRWLESNKALQMFKSVFQRRAAPFVIHTSVLLALVTSASYAGTSNLFAAYLAGALISWWDTITVSSAGQRQLSRVLVTGTTLQDNAPSDCAEHGHCERAEGLQQEMDFQVSFEGSLGADTISEAPGLNSAPNIAPNMSSKANQTISESARLTPQVTSRNGVAVYEEYYLAPVDKILKPLFFASIGFSIPISQMFRGSVVWRGIVYACLMIVGKLVCGLWLVRFDSHAFQEEKADDRAIHGSPPKSVPSGPATNSKPMSCVLPKPKSLYPASILGSAMVARGEIGFVVSAIAQSNGIFNPTNPSSSSKGSTQDLFFIVTWAIMLCTVIGPVTVGLTVQRVRRLQSQRKGLLETNLRADPLGVWGLAEYSPK